MRKLVIALGGLAVIGLVLPIAGRAEEEKVVIKEHRDRGLHLGERHRDHDRLRIRFGERHEHRDHERIVIKERRGHRDHDHD
jgi:hypothetical protein